MGAVALLLVAAAAPGTSASTATWTALPDRSRIDVHVFKKGLLSGAAHDHDFLVGTWHANATFDPRRPEDAHVVLVLAADSLKDQEPALSPQDREKVDRQAASDDVLDAHRYPEVRFVSEGPIHVTAARPPDDVQGQLKGILSVHGRRQYVSGPIHVQRQGDGWHAQGSVRFKQSDFGIRPYSGFLGTVAVHDEVEVVYDLVVTPAG